MSRGRTLVDHDRKTGARWVVGADEAGRGCLAGPLVAGAVLLDLHRIGPAEVRALGAPGRLEEAHRGRAERLFGVVLRLAVRIGVATRCVEGLDDRGLHVTNLEALSTAARSVARPGALCRIDGFRVPDIGYAQEPVVGGDHLSAAIAAASIVAKVTRDRFMHRAHERHPEWNFAQHKGYGTAAQPGSDPHARHQRAPPAVVPLDRLRRAGLAPGPRRPLRSGRPTATSPRGRP